LQTELWENTVKHVFLMQQLIFVSLEMGIIAIKKAQNY
jgi:hypothetical protein